MSRRFLILSAIMIVGAVVIGIALGRFAVTSQRPAMTALNVVEGNGDDSDGMTPKPESVFQSSGGGQEVRCSGCGPTLADRQSNAAISDGEDAGYGSADHDRPYRHGDIDPGEKDRATPPPTSLLPDQMDADGEDQLQRNY